jgi:hypothetical protein
MGYRSTFRPQQIAKPRSTFKGRWNAFKQRRADKKALRQQHKPLNQQFDASGNPIQKQGFLSKHKDMLVSTGATLGLGIVAQKGMEAYESRKQRKLEEEEQRKMEQENELAGQNPQYGGPEEEGPFYDDYPQWDSEQYPQQRQFQRY